MKNYYLFSYVCYQFQIYFLFYNLKILYPSIFTSHFLQNYFWNYKYFLNNNSNLKFTVSHNLFNNFVTFTNCFFSYVNGVYYLEENITVTYPVRLINRLKVNRFHFGVPTIQNNPDVMYISSSVPIITNNLKKKNRTLN